MPSEHAMRVARIVLELSENHPELAEELRQRWEAEIKPLVDQRRAEWIAIQERAASAGAAVYRAEYQAWADAWKQEFGEPPPNTRDEYIAWAYRLGWPASKTEAMDWTYGDVLTRAEGYLAGMRERAGLPRTEPNGPVPGFRWRYGGKVTTETMPTGAWRMADYLWSCDGMSAAFSDLAPVVADDREDDLLDSNAARGHQRRANKFFGDNGIPLKVSIASNVASLIATE